MAEELIELGRDRKCKPGEILRKGYTTKRGVRVPPTCVLDVGAKGKTPARKRWFPAGVTLPGWSKDKPASARHAALRKLVDGKPCVTVLRDVNAIANVTADRETERKLRADRKWLRDQGFCKLVTKERSK